MSKIRLKHISTSSITFNVQQEVQIHLYMYYKYATRYDNLFTLDVLCLTGKLGTVSSSMMLDPSGPGKGRGTLAGKGS